MRPTARQFNALAASVGKGAISRVTITLDGPLKVNGNDPIQTGGGPAGFPMEEHIGTRTAARPEITLFGSTMSRLQIINRRLIHLHITARHHPGPDLFVNRLEPVRRQLHPTRQRLSG